MNIGPYQVISEIGHGGMGVVYEAQSPADGQTVAIKMIQVKMVILQAPPEVSANQRFVLTVEITNPSAWVLTSMPPAPVNISYHWMSGDGQTYVVWDGVRTLIRPPLAPGAGRRFEAAVVAPSHPGKYRLSMTLVQEGVQWFDAPPLYLGSEVVIQITAPC